MISKRLEDMQDQRKPEDLIRLEEIEFSYPERVIFENLSFVLKKGERIGLMGPNGAGKTTLLRLIMGLNRPRAGQVIIFGQKRRREEDFYEVRRRIGFLFQDPEDQLFCPTVAEDIAFGPLNLGFPRDEVKRLVAETLDLLGLRDLEKRPTYRLSGGEKRMVALGTILAMRPEVLILDEPTGDLDPANTNKLKKILKSLKRTYLIVSHDYYFLASLCDRILWFERGLFREVTKDDREVGPDPDKTINHIRLDSSQTSGRPS
ncbi:energy-coupling factor ABC transporter ATP-binding protein [Thermosulfuriphilus sp.]